MKRIAGILVCFCLFVMPAEAQFSPDERKYLSRENPVLSADEKAALALAEKWQNSEEIPAFSGRNGAIRYVFGSRSPRIICAVFRVCDLALQPGERVRTIRLGDTGRWTVELASSGTGVIETQHLLIKPQDSGLDTNLVITTDRRVYHLRLVSHRTEYMPYVAFTYPEEAFAKWDTVLQEERREREEQILPATGEYLGDLSFNYRITGSAPWKPARVYNDGNRTVIQMPGDLDRKEQPVLIVAGEGKDGEQAYYRMHKDRYIVDTVFRKAVLVSGTGRSRQEVTIIREDT